ANKEKLTKYYGVKGLPTLRQVGSLDRAHSYLWDCTHLFLKNNIPNLIKHWTRKFKGLDSGSEDYMIPEEIWQETADVMKDIPSSFSCSLATGPGKFPTEVWCFWFVYMAQGLLQNRFSDPKYHVHLCELAEIIKTYLKFNITHDEIDTLEERIVQWV
ncbi:hypothetical protein B0H10DRAFT_1687772, partial [Mycena sp. CBHHK59/15]